MDKKQKKAEIILEYQDLIERPPVDPGALHKQACMNDEVTIDSWRPTWVENIKKNNETYGPFTKNGVGKHFGRFACRPVICAGSGPSLRGNGHLLKDRPKEMGLVSCLHNFHFMEDMGADVDFYVTLDAGKITIDEVTSGGVRSEEEYWALTEGKKLIAFTGSAPELLEKWRGEISFFHCPVPDKDCVEAIKETGFFQHMGSGGNVLGASLYFAKGYLKANPIIFVGADFSFGYNQKFHPWDSQYDKNLGHVLKVTDIFGNKVKTWQSYFNFCSWFNWVGLNVPGIYVNATEGGCLGAYPEGNLNCFKYMDLGQVFEMYKMSDHLKPCVEKPEVETPVILF